MQSVVYSSDDRQRARLARELALGAPVAGLLWLLVLRLLLGTWSPALPLGIVGCSLLLALLMICPAPVGPAACRLWRGLVGAIDWLVTRVVCAALYYLLLTPLGLILRLCRVPLVPMRPDPDKESHWRAVAPPGDPRRHFFRQY